MKRTNLRIIVGVACACAFGALVYALPKKGGLELDVFVARQFAAHESDVGVVAFTWISWLGDTALSGFLVAGVLVLSHRRRWAAALTTIIATFGGLELNLALKGLFHRGRPDYALEFIAGPTWSFPSGHSMASLIGFGVIAYFRSEYEQSAHRRRVIVTSLYALVAAVGLSRVYLGAHYVSDVVGGFLAGGAWLCVCLEIYSRIGMWRARNRNVSPSNILV